MKKDEAIERLKAGDTLLYDNGPKFPSANFKSDGKTLRFDIAFSLRYSGFLNVKKSQTALGLEYLTWKPTVAGEKNGGRF